MSYRHAFIGRWTRRDRLAAVVIALTVGFLVGTSILVVAGGGQLTGLAAEFDATGSATFVDGSDEVSTDGLVLPVAPIETSDGTRTVAVGVPQGTDRAFGDDGRRLERGTGTTLGTVTTPRNRVLIGDEGRVKLTVTPRSDSVFPPSWYVLSPETIETLGQSGAIVIDDSGSTETGVTVPLRGALPFFATGTGEALQLLGILVVASGLLIGVTVYSVTRMSIQDRLEAIRVARSTGATPRTILGVFAARAGLLTAVGSASGYAIGVIVVSAAVNVAVVLGVPTSIDPSMTWEIARIIGVIVAIVPVVGAIAGVIAARPAATGPPNRLGKRRQRGWGQVPVIQWGRPRLLDGRIVVPTTATLAAFAVFALLFVAAIGVVIPMAGGGEVVVTEPDAIHPLASQLPEGYSDAFESQGIDASAEILLFGVIDDRPVPVRGAAYDDFAAVSDAELVTGSGPIAGDEAVVGSGVARRLDLQVGDRLPLGGSTQAGLTEVTVVGIYDAPSPYGDHIIVPLETARHLSGVREDTVHLIRGTDEPAPTGEGLSVTGLAPSEQPVAGDPIEVTVDVANQGVEPLEESVAIRMGPHRRVVNVSLQPAGRATRTVTFTGVEAGDYCLCAGDLNRTVTVRSPDEIHLESVPTTAPPGSEPMIRVVDARGRPVSKAEVTVDGRTVRTDTNGTARLWLPSPGQYDINATRNDKRASRALTVSEKATRRPHIDLSVRPESADLLVRPTARVTLSNPWNVTLEHDVTLKGPASSTTEQYTLAPSDRVTLTHQVARRPTGTYSVVVRLDGEDVGEQEYRVVGDERIVSALATRGQTADSPFEQAIATAFGNLQVLAGALVSLAALMAIGATTATFADAVHARRETLGIKRAVGASPGSILWVVLGDALRIGLMAAIGGTGLALAVLWALDAVGVLAMFGIRLLPGLAPFAVIGVVVAAVVVAVLGAGIAVLGVLRVSPAELLTGRIRTDTEELDA